jgi:signal transduction histidine kinase
VRSYQTVLLKILEISEEMRANLELDELFDIVCKAITEELQWEQAIIVLRDIDSKTSRPMAARGMPEHIRQKILSSPPSRWTQWYKIPEFQVSNSYYVRNLHEHMDIVPEELYQRMEVGNHITRDKSKWQGDDFLMIPIRAEEEWVGMINVDNPSDGLAPNEEDIKMLELFANQVSIAIRNAKAFEKQKDFNRQLAREVEKKTKLLEEQYLELQTYISSLTHDLKTPIVSINAMVGVLKEELDNECSEEAEYLLGRLTKNAERMSKILHDLIAYYNIQKTSMRKDHLDTREIIMDEFYRARDMYPEKVATISLEGDFPNLTQSKLAFSLIVGNLFTNALKFSKPDQNAHVIVSVKKEKSRYIFSVADNGIGFDMKYLDRIFKLFERLADKRTEGTGIGLATVKKMAEKMGGTVWAESKVGHGATFFFTVPA